MHFWSFLAKYCHFLHILSNAWPKSNVYKVPGMVSLMWVTKLLISPVIIRIFCPKTTEFGPNLEFLSIVGSFGALLVRWLVVVTQGHLLTLCSQCIFWQNYLVRRVLLPNITSVLGKWLYPEFPHLTVLSTPTCISSRDGSTTTKLVKQSGENWSTWVWLLQRKCSLCIYAHCSYGLMRTVCSS